MALLNCPDTSLCLRNGCCYRQNRAVHSSKVSNTTRLVYRAYKACEPMPTPEQTPSHKQMPTLPFFPAPSPGTRLPLLTPTTRRFVHHPLERSVATCAHSSIHPTTYLSEVVFRHDRVATNRALHLSSVRDNWCSQLFAAFLSLNR
jgi:hypothetical protein